MSDILLIDDDGDLVHSLARALSPKIAPLTLCGVSSVDKAQATFRSSGPKVVVVDLCLDEKRGVESGFAMLEELRSIDATARFIVLTGHGSRAHGVRALSLGAASFIEKPVDPVHLAAVIKDAATQADLRRDHNTLSQRTSAQRAQQFIGIGNAAQRLREQLAFAAATRQPVLLVGETGTGKGLCARIIHESSSVANGRFVHYQPNFGGADLVQSELFGHVKGAFTGALEARTGLAVEAHLGTLFIDEIDETPKEVQIRLLDLIQERRVRPVGADRHRSVECQFIAATNCDIDAALLSGKVRRDLFHRVAYNVIRIPPLRERMEDVAELCSATLKRLQENNRIQVFHLHEDVQSILSAYDWPGNVRELQAVVENAAHRARYANRTVINPQDIHMASSCDRGPVSRSLHDRIEELKRKLIQEAVAECRGNHLQAAKILGVDRGTLRRVLGRVVS